MKIATWNVNSLRARWPRVDEWLRLHEPDVVLVQETKQTDETFPTAALADLGYESAHHGQGQWNGVAIFSRVGLTDVERGLGEVDAHEARIIGATCGGLRVYSCYIPNGRALDDPHYTYKLNWLAALADRVEGHTGGGLLLGGDFNVAPTDFDCWDPEALAGATHVSEPERAAIARLTNAGLVDLGRRAHPDEPAFTWWDYRNGAFRRGWGMRIDFLFATPDVAEVTSACDVDRDARKGEKPSDHAPVVATITL